MLHAFVVPSTQRVFILGGYPTMHPKKVDSFCLNLKRFFHMLEDADGNDVDRHGVDTPYLLVVLHRDNLTEQLLSLPIISPTFSWTRNMIYALLQYGKWQESEVSVVKALSLHTCRLGCVTLCVNDMYSARYNGSSSCLMTPVGGSASWQRRDSVTGSCRAT